MFEALHKIIYTSFNDWIGFQQHFIFDSRFSWNLRMAEEVTQWCSSTANIQCVLMEFTLRVSSSTIRMTTPRRRKRMTSSARDGISSSSHSYTSVTVQQASCCVLRLVLSGRSDNLLLSEHHTSGEEASSPRPDARCCRDNMWEWYYHPPNIHSHYNLLTDADMELIPHNRMCQMIEACPPGHHYRCGQITWPTLPMLSSCKKTVEIFTFTSPGWHMTKIDPPLTLLTKDDIIRTPQLS